MCIFLLLLFIATTSIIQSVSVVHGNGNTVANTSTVSIKGHNHRHHLNNPNNGSILRRSLTSSLRTNSDYVMRGSMVRGGGALAQAKAVDRKIQDEEEDMTSASSKIRSAIFPVYGVDEITKFSILGALKFFIIIALTLTRDTKDTLIVTQCGAEAISFLKIYGVLPAAIAFTGLYGKASNIISSKEMLFNVTCLPFFVFFVLYDVLIRPNLEFLEPSVDTVRSVLGSGLSEVVVKILSHWTSALFFVVAEIYSSVSIGILFWKTANDFVTVSLSFNFTIEFLDFVAYTRIFMC